ncbi:hypothetical protein SKAU_G00045880 [Synaphobranchus kaupii]|uniref:Uncharacterized protein n=1 Tax=Synaphobranchus kaupii TaxID=118154 RepID=A0A9Q1G2W3_SYNKA|nr:hypothetical protein SKAU_G00045880 [Synaphobranchus kaupii]
MCPFSPRNNPQPQKHTRELTCSAPEAGLQLGRAALTAPTWQPYVTLVRSRAFTRRSAHSQLPADGRPRGSTFLQSAVRKIAAAQSVPARTQGQNWNTKSLQRVPLTISITKNIRLHLFNRHPVQAPPSEIQAAQNSGNYKT